MLYLKLIIIKENKMQTVSGKLRKIGFIILISFCVNVTVSAQTPADDPGIGGPGTSGAAPAGDGAPIVPFDSNITLLFLVGSIGIVARKLKNDESLLN